MPRIEVFPQKNGEWRWKSEGKRSSAFATRHEAFEDALLERTTEQIVLLRKDGSVYGELYHGAGNGNPPQRVDLLAATTRDGAKGL